MKILICDDEPMVRLGLISMLEEIEPDIHDYIQAENGLELIDAVMEQPDIAFVDIQMPLMDGLGAIEKAKEKSPATRWFLVTGHSKFEYAKKAISLGITDYLLKPVGVSDISNVMKKVNRLKSNDHLVKKYLKAITDVDFDVTSSQSIASKIQTITDIGNNPEFQADIVSKAKAYIQSNYCKDIGVDSIADILGITPNYLSRLFREQTGVRLKDHITQLRIEKAKSLINTPGYSIKKVAEEVGYYSARHFSKVFFKVTGKTPSEFRETE